MGPIRSESQTLASLPLPCNSGNGSLGPSFVEGQLTPRGRIMTNPGPAVVRTTPPRKTGQSLKALQTSANIQERDDTCRCWCHGILFKFRSMANDERCAIKTKRSQPGPYIDSIAPERNISR